MHVVLTTRQIHHKYHISYWLIYKWVRRGKLDVGKDWYHHYIWDTKAQLSLRRLIDSHSLPTKNKQELFCINNRRYLGSKETLLPFIKGIIRHNTKDVELIGDIFAGTGVVSDMLLNDHKNVIINDILHSNHVFYRAFLGNGPYSVRKIMKYLKRFNDIHKFDNNYLVYQYGNKYFTNKNASKIGQAREILEESRNKLTSREFAILLTSILYAADKVANTVGHYDAYRVNMTNVKPVYFRMLKLRKRNNTRIYMDDANYLVRNIYADLIYIDTPYNSRQYVNSYHVLENIADWKKPYLYGKARKPKQIKDRRSKYNLSSAPKVFNDLITHINARYILVSFNNMAHKGVGRSNSKISNEGIINTMSKRGHVKVFSKPFRPFNSGKTHLKNHKELLYLVKVTK